MFFSYFKYFFKFIVFSKSRQRLLILAIAGLFLSGLALIILQSTMGGLQHNLIERSKNVSGSAYIKIPKNIDATEIVKLEKLLNEKNILFSREYEIELLVRYKSYLTPVIVHGIDTLGFVPEFIANEKFVNGMMPMEIAYKIEVLPNDTIQLISPSHVDSLFADIPRSQSVKIDKIFSTDVPEIDMFHMWVRLPLIQNLVQSKSFNRIRIYSNTDFKLLRKNIFPGFVFKTWEEENGALVWALNLESSIMIFLFAAMSLLVSLCITSGLLIFFNKIKNDLSSFWILGASLKKINNSTSLFLHLITFSSIVSGVGFGIILLLLFDKLGANIMPEVFVDRKIPVLITFKGIFISMLVPYLISFVFINLSLKQFRKEYHLLDHVKAMS